jgi:metal-responsive CopG/Arc/MetJ family transcriptional regulator
MNKTTVYLPTELQGALRDVARRTGRSQAEVIRDAIAAYVAVEERPWPRSFGSAANGEVSAADLEDWLAENWKPDW